MAVTIIGESKVIDTQKPVGRHDETVDWHASLAYAESHPGVELHLVVGDHRLTATRHEDFIAACALDLIARM